MELSKETFAILKNFSTISGGIHFTQDSNFIKACEPNGQIFAKAITKETMPKSFCIADLNRFISLSSMIDEADFEFEDTCIRIKNDSRELKYFYSAPEIVKPWTKVTVDWSPSDEEVLNFTMSGKQFKDIQKICSSMSATELHFMNRGGLVVMSASHKSDSSSNNAENQMFISCDTTTTIDIDISFKILTMLFVDGDYDVSISRNGIATFKNNNMNVEYILPALAGSIIDGKHV